jgi:hypothetical protein
MFSLIGDHDYISMLINGGHLHAVSHNTRRRSRKSSLSMPKRESTMAAELRSRLGAKKGEEQTREVVKA